MLLARHSPAAVLSAVAATLSTTLAAPPAAATTAPPAALVKDIATRTSPFVLPIIDDALRFVRLGDRFYFSAEDGLHGRELWSTDGTAAGTTMVADICPGYCYGWASYRAVVGDRLFFSADDGAHGRELWVSDGTAAGTRLVADIVPGIEGSQPKLLTAAAGRLFFIATDQAHGTELWVSDGTEAETKLVADLAPGTDGSQPDRLTALSGGVFFTANDGTHGREPWFSDGTAAGTRMLADLRSGGDALRALPPYFIEEGSRDWGALNGRVVFAARDDTHGNQLWISDGTPGGTELLADISANGPSGNSEPRGFTEMAGRLYFEAKTPADGRELWVTDGVANTHRVSDIAAGSSFSTAVPLGSSNGWLYFAGYTNALGSELWKTDGSSANTELVIDAVPGSGGSLDWNWASRGVALGTRFVYFAETAATGVEPWITDGTTAGTTLLKDVFPGKGWSTYLYLNELAVIGGEAYFIANDPTHGFEPWRTDGTEAGTQLLADLDQEEESVLSCYWFHCLEIGAVGADLFAGLWEPDHGLEPWASRGTPGTTRLLADLMPTFTEGFADGSAPGGFGRAGRVALFSAYTGAGGDGLWRTDGSTIGTSPIPGVFGAQQFTPLGDTDFFTASTPAEGNELWISDGSVAGTHLIADLVPGPDDSSPNDLTALGGRLLFSATGPDQGEELWSSEGTDIDLVADLDPGPGSSVPRSLAASGNRVFFSADLPGSGRELWVSDGTEPGTEPIVDLNPGPASGMKDEDLPGIDDLPEIAAGAGGSAFFLGDDGSHGTEPWWTDGTESGTHSLGDLRAGPVSSSPRFLTSLDGRAFFAADDGVHGRELWTSDGTEAGTRMVTDLVPGVGSSLPQWLTPVDGLLYFSAYRPDVGVELWRTDGTEAGTELVADVYPGAEPSTPEFLTVAGRRLFFTADDGTHGFEPWAMLLPGRLPRLSLTWSGTPLPGSILDFVVVLTNPPPRPMPDGDGDELTLPLPPDLVYLGDGQATSGVLAFTGPGGIASDRPSAARTGALTAGGGGTLRWNGSLPPGGSVTLTFRGRIGPAVPLGTVLTLVADGRLDSDEDGSSDFLFTSDDPARPGEEDPTEVVVGPLAIGVPAAGSLGLVLLAVLLAGLAVRRLVVRRLAIHRLAG